MLWTGYALFSGHFMTNGTLLLYILLVGASVALAWHFPFLFEIPLLAALAGAWLIFSPPRD